ncbi:hypothetical protein K474DRAFT_1664239 [Panus rudis PR-1116 ss-1]|nr:hypothetical protein K474DRAFT_1664239 [Panus rudis PR-1116 ss-1]
MSSALSQLGIDASEGIELISEDRTETMLYLIVLSLLTYDTILTFPQEVRCIWQRKWTGATFLYATIRYITMLHMVIQIIGVLLVPEDVQMCRVIYYTEVAIATVAVAAVPVFECLRVWAISGEKWILAIAVLALGFLAPCVNIYTYSLPASFILIKSGPLFGCWGNQTFSKFQYFGPVVRAGAICSDVIVLTVTLCNTLQTVRTSQNLSIRTRYTSLLLYTGKSLLIFNILNIIFDILGIKAIYTSAFSSHFIVINEGLSAIIICRLMLNLRFVHLQNDMHTGSISSIKFSNSIIGNLGAPIQRDSLSFNSAELDDILEQEKIIYSEHSLMVDQTREAATQIELQDIEQADAFRINDDHNNTT